MKVTKKIRKAIKLKVEQNQPVMYWDRWDFDRKNIKNIIEIGIDAWIDELVEQNQEYIWQLESELVKAIQDEYPDYNTNEIEEIVLENIAVDLDFENFLSQIPDVTCVVYLHSNYDCCNSFDQFEPEGYIYEVYQRVKAGVKKSDYLHEFHNGAYGGSLFCFVFKASIEEYFKLAESIKISKTITIPKGTQYGFFSSFQGAGSVFEKTTYRKMTIPITETQYDCIAFTVDEAQHYSMIDVYGDNSFIKQGTVTFKEAV
jgi:hypothetical protein